MVDFAEAFRAGLRAATEADAALAEIRGEVASLDRATRTAYGVGVEVRGDALWMVRVADGPERGQARLCGWQVDARGYPVTIRGGGDCHVALDHEGLVAALCEVLATSTTGRALAALLGEVPRG